MINISLSIDRLAPGTEQILFRPLAKFTELEKLSIILTSIKLDETQL